MKRHPHIVHLNDVRSQEQQHGTRFSGRRKRLAAATGGKELGCSWYEIPEGKQAFPHHFHFGNEEALFILSGTGELRLGDGVFTVNSGDYISLLPQEDHAHSLKNVGTGPLTYLSFSTAHSTDIIVYPDSKKFFVSGGGNMHEGLKSAKFTRMLKDTPGVDYYEDE